MSQPHPPIPEPQPQSQPEVAPGQATGSTAASLADDDPRTQSILLPPSQRPETPGTDPQAPGNPTTGPITAQSAPAATGVLPAQSGPDAAAPAYEASYQPPYQPSYDSSSQQGGGYGQQGDGSWQQGDSSWQQSGTAPYQPDGQATWQPPSQPAGGPGHQPGHGGTDQVTGPVGFVPGFPPGPGHQAGPATATHLPAADPDAARGSSAGSPLTAVRRAGRDRTLLIGLGLVVLALVLLEVGLALDFGNQSLWEVVPTWSTLATVAVLVVLVPFAVRLSGRSLPAGTAWRAGAVGLGALAAFWVLVALPLVASDRGFWLTAALGAAGAALWLAPGRSE